MAKTYWNQYVALQRINQKINCSAVTLNKYEKQGIVGPDIYYMWGKKRLPGYSDETIEVMIQVIRKMRLDRSEKGLENKRIREMKTNWRY